MPMPSGGYSYTSERSFLFTEEGQVMFLKVRDASKILLKKAGAFRQMELLSESKVTGSSWSHIACVDRLVELGEIVELPRNCWTQYKVYTSPEVSNH